MMEKTRQLSPRLQAAAELVRPCSKLADVGTDHAFSRIGLHRVTATYLPENEASGKVLAHSGFRKEGYLKSNLHINGRWRDHVLVALTEDEFVDSCTGRLIASGAARRVTGDEV